MDIQEPRLAAHMDIHESRPAAHIDTRESRPAAHMDIQESRPAVHIAGHITSSLQVMSSGCRTGTVDIKTYEYIDPDLKCASVYGLAAIATHHRSIWSAHNTLYHECRLGVTVG